MKQNRPTFKIILSIFLIINLFLPLYGQTNSLSFPPYPITNFSIGFFSDIIVSDFDGDGLKDIAVVRIGTSKVSIFLNQTNLEDICFSSSINFSTGEESEPFCLVAADFNNDGKIDIITANHKSHDLSILRNTSQNGNLDFDLTMIPNMPTYPNIEALHPCLTIVDFNEDNLLDLVITTSTTIGKTIILKNESIGGTINFKYEVELPIAARNGKINADDFDGDGKIDLVMYGAIGTLIELIFFPNASSQNVIRFDSLKVFGGGGPRDFVSGDFDNDGKVDIAQLAFGFGEELTFIRNNSKPGNFDFHWEWNKDNPAGHGGGDHIHACDINNDQFLDLIVVKSIILGGEPKKHNYISVHINKSSTGKFDLEPFRQFGVAEDPMQIKSADFDNDGLEDLVVGHGDAASFAIIHNISSRDSLRLNSAAIFPIEFPVGPSSGVMDLPYSCPIAGADFDGDSKDDLVIASWDDNSMRVLKNMSTLGVINFNESFGHKTQFQPNSIIVADFNNDQKQDIVISNKEEYGLGSGHLSIFNNESSPGNLKFKADSVEIGEHPLSLSTGDFDLDGKIDLFVGVSGYPSVYRNISNSEFISFEKAWSYPSSGGLRMISSAIADYNKDGLVDIAVSDGMMHKIHIFQNQTTSATLDFKYLGKLNGYYPSTECIKSADLDDDGFPDIVIAWQDYPCGCSILHNNSTQDSIIFSDPINYQPLSNPSSLYISDMTGDNKPDIIVGDPFSQTCVLENRSTLGNIEFEPAFPGGIILGDVKGDNNYYVADFDGDGCKDIAAPRSDQQELWVLRTFNSSYTLVQTQEKQTEIPKEFNLYQNYPNPFNPTTSIDFSIPKTGFIEVKVFDVVGREVKTLFSEFTEAGSYHVIWDGSDKQGMKVSTGVYFYVLGSDEYSIKKKAIFLK